MTGWFTYRLGAGETLDALLPEILAAGREAGVRALGQRAVDEQIAGAAALCAGRLVEMRTGEGKTLAIALAAYAWSLPGEGVHVLTANDYLAERDAAWMGPLYEMLGVSCARVAGQRGGLASDYAADVTYLTPYQAGTAFLRDQAVREPEARVQRPLSRAIIDEADLILIENARNGVNITIDVDTPALEARDRNLARAVGRLDPERDVVVDGARRMATLTDAGTVRMEDLLGVADLYQETWPELLRALDDALRARFAYLRDRDYVVLDSDVSLLSAATGRVDEIIRPEDGLRQAIEIKEGLAVSPRKRVIGMIGQRALLRRYPRLAGATGTALEDRLYREAYGLEIERIPTHAPVLRIDHAPIVYPTGEQRTGAALDRIAERRAAGRPVLVVTASIEQCGTFAAALGGRGIPHEVLTAANHGQEAEIFARAGRVGAVTVVTRMAGRGVDIRLGGDDPAEHESVVRAGGLYVLGFDLYENRRLELQMRGRAGRRGDPGESDVLLSLQDPSTRGRFPAYMHALLDQTLKSSGRPLDTSVMLAKSFERALDNATLRLEDTLLLQIQGDAVGEEQTVEIYRLRDEFLDGARAHAAFLACLESCGDAELKAAYARRVEQLSEPVIHELERLAGMAMIDKQWPDHLITLKNTAGVTTFHSLTGSAWNTHYRQLANERFQAMRARLDRDVVEYVLQQDPDPRTTAPTREGS